MKSFGICLILAALVAAAIAAFWVVKGRVGSESWVEYQPMVWSHEKDGLALQPELMKTDHVNAIMLVLSHYSEPFRFEPGPPQRIFITRKLAGQQELLWNFTSKAELLRQTGRLKSLDAAWSLPAPDSDNR